MATRREFLRLAGLATGTAALGFLGRVRAAESVPPKLNFIFILVDDMGQRDLGCYGSTFYETPNTDRLASQGMRFTDAYAAGPVCSPTRASILTGKYPARLHLTDYIGASRTGKLLPAKFLDHLPLEEVTLGEAFKEAGYTTFFAGKWHLGKKEFYPDRQGFETIVGVADGMKRFSPYGCKDLPDGPPGEYITDRLTEESLKFLDANRDRPFLLYLSHYAVHIPIEAKKEMVKRYETKAKGLPADLGPRFAKDLGRDVRVVQDHAAYGAMVESVDESVRRLMKKLDELGLAESTAIIFLSDNGGLSTAEGTPTANVPLRAGKGWLYEGGIREPLIIKWPSVTKPGSVCHEPVTSTDFYPTMLEMAGLALRPEQHVDGVSLVPLLKGTATPKREALYWHFPHYSNQGGPPCGAVRAGDLKLIEWYEDDRVELYCLKDDIGEKTDLAARMPEKVEALRKRLHDWRQSVGAVMPTANPNFGKEPPVEKPPAAPEAKPPASATAWSTEEE
jgi:arylsulfatase A-like enzyme